MLKVLKEGRNQLHSPPPDSNGQYLNATDQGCVFLAFISSTASWFRLSSAPRVCAVLPKGFLWSQAGQCMIRGLNLRPRFCSYKILTGMKTLCASIMQLPLKPTRLAKEIKAMTCLDMAHLFRHTWNQNARRASWEGVEDMNLGRCNLPAIHSLSFVEYDKFWNVFRLWLFFLHHINF